MIKLKPLTIQTLHWMSLISNLNVMTWDISRSGVVKISEYVHKPSMTGPDRC